MKYQKVSDNGYCWCDEEQALKPCSNFFRIKQTGEYHTLCKSCDMKVKKRVQRDNEYEITKLLLRKLGYEPETETTIYEQFIKKHQL